ncbi:GNAT family N-acetyltransferase [Erythrobacter ani]|uniref:GNAT family N-acetyltransferase n=1 Tax=Erythrobacter ani TaxID=2827235 RepID=A0ABS6SKH5_9SPHN|nr:GNAT family N-acetyltransferase [Erythrobacter ani]MBV7265485.1 GNAT family N-acetyltransferase [Erythrobacter ani]
MSELSAKHSQNEALTRFSNREAEKEWSGVSTTRAGEKILIRPATPEDKDALARFFEGVSRRDLFFRFLSGMRKVDEERLAQMVDDTNDHTIDFLAVDPDSGEILASAMLGADESFENAEFAVCTREDMKQRGISWAMLDHAARYAESKGIAKITSLESAQQRDGLELERGMGFRILPCPDEPALIIAEKTF